MGGIQRMVYEISLPTYCTQLFAKTVGDLKKEFDITVEHYQRWQEGSLKGEFLSPPPSDATLAPGIGLRISGEYNKVKAFRDFFKLP